MGIFEGRNPVRPLAIQRLTHSFSGIHQAISPVAVAEQVFFRRLLKKCPGCKAPEILRSEAVLGCTPQTTKDEGNAADEAFFSSLLGIEPDL